MPVHIAPDPLSCVVLGTGKYLEIIQRNPSLRRERTERATASCCRADRRSVVMFRARGTGGWRGLAAALLLCAGLTLVHRQRASRPRRPRRRRRA